MRKNTYILTLLKTSIVTLWMVLIYVSPAHAQVVADESGKCGYKDEQGNIVIPYKYDFISPFTDENVALVRIDDMFGMVDKSGQEVIPTAYSQIIPTTGGYYLLRINNKYGLASPQGQLVYEPKYLFIYPFNHQGIAKAVVSMKSGKMLDEANTYALLRNDGVELYRGKGDDLSFFSSGYNNTVDYIGTLQSDTVDTSTGYFYSGKTNSYYDLDGKQVFNDAIRDRLYKEMFSKKASRKNNFFFGGKTIEYNPSNDIVLLRYNQRIKDDNHATRAVGYYNLKKQKLIWHGSFTCYSKYNYSKHEYECIADDVNIDNKSFNDGFAVITISGKNKEENKDLVINTDGDIVGQYGKGDCCDYKNGYMVLIGENRKSGVVDTKQQQVIPFEYDYGRIYVDVTPDGKGNWKCCKDKKWGAVSLDNTILIPFEYDELYSWWDRNICGAKKNGKWGVYQYGKQILECIYDSIFSLDMDEDIFTYKYEGQYGVYSCLNNTLSPTHDGYEGCFIADRLLHGSEMRCFYLLTKEKVKVYGYLDGYGNTVVPFMFTDKDQATEAYYYFRDKPTQKFSYTDRYRLRLFFSRKSRLYQYDSKEPIPETDWDY